jgi:hypothetical protein
MRKTTNEIINKVNQFIENMGLSDSILGLKNKDDKILYYYNYMDNIDNRFCSKVEFPNLYHLKLANMLCNTDEKYDYFMDTYYNEDNIVGSIENFKKYIKEQRTYEKDIIKNIDIAIKGADYILAWSLIQELYLEPLDEYFLNRFIEMVNSGLTATDIYTWYKTKKRFLSIMTFDIKYIKSIGEI